MRSSAQFASYPACFMPSYSHSILSVKIEESPSCLELFFSLSGLLCSCLPEMWQGGGGAGEVPLSKSPALANTLQPDMAVQVEEAQARAEEDRQRREGQQCVPVHVHWDCKPFLTACVLWILRPLVAIVAIW